MIWLIRAAQKIGVPVAAVEQYPKGLGRTVRERARSPAGRRHRAEGPLLRRRGAMPASLPGADRAQIVLIGIETHVCLLQTALELIEEGKEVYVVADAVGSRQAADRDCALARMRQEGARIVSREMVVFEWLGEAGTPLFRAVSREFLRG